MAATLWVRACATLAGCWALIGCHSYGLLLNDRSNTSDANLVDNGVVCFWVDIKKAEHLVLEVEHQESGDKWRMQLNPHLTGSDAVVLGPTAADLQDPEVRNLETSYILYQLPGGTYEFVYFRHITDDELFLAAARESRFTVRPGEITYIGTYEFSQPDIKVTDPVPVEIGEEIKTADYFDEVRQHLAKVKYLGIGKMPVSKELAPLELYHPLERLLSEESSPARVHNSACLGTTAAAN